MTDEQTYGQEFASPQEGRADKCLRKSQRSLQEGKMRRFVIKNRNERVVVDIPLWAGIVLVVLAPELAIIGLLVAVASSGTILVEKVEQA